MLRLIHKQTGAGALLVDDIDDGIPNKQVHRLGSTADPKAYKRDGYANEPKQKCYIPRTKEGDATLPGFIDLNRHAVMHGESLDYGSEENGLKAVSLLNYVSYILSEDPELERDGAGP